MMYAKFIDSHTIEPLLEPCVTYKGRVYVNPCTELMNAAGYYKVKEVEEKPSYNEETQYLVPCYSVKFVGLIEKRYEVTDIEEVNTEESEVE